MIINFNNKLTDHLFNGVESKETKKFDNNLHEIAKRKLDLINSITEVEKLRLPPSNHLKLLTGKRANIWSIRINDKWRICFKWENGNAYDVEIVNYH
ncbi:MAG: type toxin-antitoxin system RelE/ParE family toxin [Gammaproteobacteria bacterium]|nr:type toxin-antitoxin system RelE/ParE family toxin [Gammaproteobacteria bacterium]